MKKEGKIVSSRIEFGLDALKEELEKIKTRKVTTNKKPKVKISNFLRKKSSNAKKHNIKKLGQKKHKKIHKLKVQKHKHKIITKIKKHRFSSNTYKPRTKIEFPDISEKTKINEEVKEKVPSHLFGKTKKIVISKEFKKFEEKFRYEFVFFFGLIIAIIGLLPDSKINIFFLFGLSLIFISLFRYNWQKRKKKKDQIQTQKEIKEVTKKIKTITHQIKEPKSKKYKSKNIKIIIVIMSLFLLLYLLAKANITSLPSNVSVFVITLLSIVLILFFLIIIFSKKRKTAIKQGSEIDINQARLVPIIIRQLKMPETYFDLVMEIVNKRGMITISELAKTFRITKERAEEWAIILVDHNLITLYYPPIGEPILKKIVKKNKEEEKNNAKTNP